MIRTILDKIRHDGTAGRTELLNSIEGVSSRPVPRIVLRAGRKHSPTLIAPRTRAALRAFDGGLVRVGIW